MHRSCETKSEPIMIYNKKPTKSDEIYYLREILLHFSVFHI